MAWIYLFLAGVLEIVWAFTMQQSNGFSVLLPSVLTIILASLCFFFLEKAMQDIGAGVSYVIFTGIGTVGTTLLGVFIFKNPLPVLQIIAIGLILTGIIGLKNAGNEAKE